MATAEADDDALGKRPEDDARNLNFKPRWNLTTTLARLLLEQRSLPGALSLGPMNAAFSGSWPRTTTARAKLAGATPNKAANNGQRRSDRTNSVRRRGGCDYLHLFQSCFLDRAASSAGRVAKLASYTRP